ncbi:MAG: UbiA family prenyltransferase [Verrucomicrobiales bacterium]
MSPASHLRTLLILGRVSNLPTVWSNVLVGWFLAGGSWTGEPWWILLGMSLLYVGGMTLNDAFDADWDREHAPDRPVPSGKISTASAWTIGAIELLGGLAVLFAGSSAHWILLSALVVSILLYNWLHKRWAGSVLFMGLCRAFVYLGAGSAVVSHTSALEVPPLLAVIAAGAVLYIAGLTLAARAEHLKDAKGPAFFPRILLMLPILFPLLGSQVMPDGPVRIALIVIGILGVWSWLVITRTALRTKVPVGVAYAIAGIAFYDASIVVFADWRAAVACLVCFVLTLATQRFIPAT